MTLVVGEPAPDFTLPDQHGTPLTLSSFRERQAVLVVFYPFAFSGVCTGELLGFRDRLGDFETETSTLLTISCDSVFTQRAQADRDALFFPLLSDFWPHGSVTRQFGIFDEERGCPRRSSFIIDRAGRLAWQSHAEWGVPRNLDEHAARFSQVF